MQAFLNNIKEDYARFVLAVMIVIVTAFYLGHVSFAKTALSDTLVGAVLGYLFAQIQTVYNFYFGSSSGSLEKTRSMTEVIKTNVAEH